MSDENFLKLLNLIMPLIIKQTTNIREPIPADFELAATIRYFSTGATFTDLQFILRAH